MERKLEPTSTFRILQSWLPSILFIHMFLKKHSTLRYTHALRWRGSTNSKVTRNPQVESKSHICLLFKVFIRKGNDISIILALDFGVLTMGSRWFVFFSVLLSPSWPISLLFLLFFLFKFFSVQLKKKKIQCHKTVHLNSAHMTFPPSLIASIQFISASHARPQSINMLYKEALVP